jgi:predicted MFS family arabinose efflux permease
MATSSFNAGTAFGTWITAAALDNRLGELALPVVGVAFAVVIFVPLTALISAVRQPADVDPGLHPTHTPSTTR